MKLVIASLIFIISGAAFSQDCTYQVDQKDIKLVWTAFKTPAKVGVKGSFKDLGIKQDKLASKTVSGLLDGVKFAIATPTVATKNSQRDAKIAKFFFKNVKAINGSVLEADESSLNIGLEMNGVKKELPMSVTYEGETLKATGVVDVMDFSMGEHLASLNKACFELHQGKTWSDVSLELTAKVTKTCK